MILRLFAFRMTQMRQDRSDFNQLLTHLDVPLVKFRTLRTVFLLASAQPETVRNSAAHGCAAIFDDASH